MPKGKAYVRYRSVSPTATKVVGQPMVGWYTAQIETRYVKKYHSGLIVQLALSPSARTVLDTALELMDEWNYVANNSHFKKHLNSVAPRKLKPNTINKGFMELVDNGLVAKQEKRGMYMVSPVFYWSGTEKDRKESIRVYLEKGHPSL